MGYSIALSRKVLSVFFALTLVLGLISPSVLAEGVEEYQEQEQEVIQEQETTQEQQRETIVGQEQVDSETSTTPSSDVSDGSKMTIDAKSSTDGEESQKNEIQVFTTEDELEPESGAEPEIVILLNKMQVQDTSVPIEVKDKDTVQVLANFTSMNAGDTYIVNLPDIFIKLDQYTIEYGNSSILDYVDLELVNNTTTKTQQVKITFKEDVLAASFSFVGTLDLTGVAAGTEKVIDIDSIGEITLITTTTPSVPSGTVGPGSFPSAPSIADYYLTKEVVNGTITTKQFMEDTAIDNAFYYALRLNYIQNDAETTSTLTDALPTGTQLFIPNAPNCGYSDYEEAFRSFQIEVRQSLVKHDADGYYLEIKSTSTRNNHINYVNRIETAQGRSASYTSDDFIWRLNIPDAQAEKLKNESGKVVTYSAFYIGYRIKSGKIELCAIGKSDPSAYEEVRIDPWDNGNDKYVPLYTTAFGEPGTVTDFSAYESVIIQSNNSGTLKDVTREYKGSQTSSDGVTTSYQWDYLYNGKVEFSLIITKNNQNDEDKIEIAMNLHEDSYLYGKNITFRPRIYFDSSKWNIPSDGKITFLNKATYSTVEKSATITYNYDFGAAGTVVVGAAKTVEDQKKTYLNPEVNPSQTYAIYFSKSGDASIPSGNFNVYDYLDSNLEYVSGSMKIYKENGSGWDDVTDDATLSDTSVQTVDTLGINLEVSHAKVGKTNRIKVTNFGEMTFTGKIKVEFDAKLNPDIKYGTHVTNYFGETVETFVDHKLTINKVDGSELITSSDAEFSIQYTTDPDYENGSLQYLKDPDGQPITSLSTGTAGTASTLYRLDASEFYLKLTEIKAPDKYTGLGETPIWIKATRNITTNEMIYAIAKAPDSVGINVNNQGLVALTVPNARQVTLLKSKVFALTGTKVLTGKALMDNMFSFTVKDVDGNTVATGTNAADGTIAFSEITFTEEGTYNYTVSEINGGAGGIAYDSNEYVVTIEVEDDGVGNLAAKASYPGGNLVFNNSYTTDSAVVALTGTKNLTGKTLTDNTFSFAVKDVDGNIVATATNKADGTISFGEIGFSAPGTYTYMVSELRGSADGYTYDDIIYEITAEVVGNEDGTLAATIVYPDGGIEFNNSYSFEASDTTTDSDPNTTSNDPKTANNDPKTTKSDPPTAKSIIKTGDNMPGIFLAILSMTAFGCIVVLSRKMRTIRKE